jgi:hypothetical protein
MSNKWFFKKGGIEVGPIDDDTMIRLIENEKIIATTPVRVGLNGEWNVAKNIEGFFDDDLEEDAAIKNNTNYLNTVPQSIPSYEFNNDPNAEVTTCPHCWTKFQLDKILYISRHPSLTGDPVIGDHKQLRFLPTVFSENGHAIDSAGEVCHEMACPYCHLHIPESIIDLDSMFYSIVGAPSSGKSYFLTAMIWELRKLLPEIFDLSFADSDTLANSVINEYERLLFLNSTPDKIVALPKTDVAGDGFSNEVMLNNMDVPITLPLPFVFTLKPMDSHFKLENEDIEDEGIKNIVLYDNAGEHFQPGEDTVHRPGTKHMIHSDGLVFLFDPVADTRMRNMCNQKDPQLTVLKDKICNQSTLLTEMITRIKKHKGINAKNKFDIPLIISVAKYDIWKHLLPYDLASKSPWNYDNKKLVNVLDYDYILNVSYHMRELLRKIAPEFVAMAESFSTQVLFIPSSSFGTPSEQSKATINTKETFLGIRPNEIHPIWVSVPMLLFLAMKGYIMWEHIDNNKNKTEAAVQNFKVIKDSIIFNVEGINERITLPVTYCGVKLYNNDANKYFTVPGEFKPLKDYKESID